MVQNHSERIQKNKYILIVFIYFFPFLFMFYMFLFLCVGNCNFFNESSHGVVYVFCCNFSFVFLRFLSHLRATYYLILTSFWYNLMQRDMHSNIKETLWTEPSAAELDFFFDHFIVYFIQRTVTILDKKFLCEHCFSFFLWQFFTQSSRQCLNGPTLWFFRSRILLFERQHR